MIDDHSLTDADEASALHQVPSKSAKKREMLALQALGEALAQLSDNQLKQIDFPDSDLKEALTFYRNQPRKHHEARRRQMQLIGKLMRRLETDDLRRQLDQVQGLGQADKRRHKLAEQWRDRLILEPKALTEFLDTFTGDAQQLNQLLRAAKKAHATDSDHGKSRALFRALYACIRH
jgi:ribosome-associated protein